MPSDEQLKKAVVGLFGGKREFDTRRLCQRSKPKKFDYREFNINKAYENHVFDVGVKNAEPFWDYLRGWADELEEKFGLEMMDDEN